MSQITDLLTPPRQTQPAGVPGNFVPGTVAENNSKDFPGMVKVNFTAWTDGKNLSKWMPVLTPYAGKKHGRYWIPEVDDIVLVGFIGPMLERPFVMGSFFPVGADIPKERFNDKNTNRFLKTKGGVTLAVSDEDGKQSVDIQTPKGLRVWIEDENETVSVADKNGKNILKLDCKSGGIEITADKKLSLKAGKCSVEMDGSSGGLTLKCEQLKLEANMTAEIKSGNMMTVKGGMVTVEAQQQLALKGTAMCEVSGGMVKIN